MIQVGCLAEFASAEALMHAARELRDRSFTDIDAYTPYPVEGLRDALGVRRSWLGWLIFILAMTGAGLGYIIQWYVNAINFPINVGGRPPHSWPTFIPITFESGVLLSGVGAFLLFFAAARLPRLWQAKFDVDGFRSASSDGFWLGIGRGQALAEPAGLRDLLTSLGATRIEVIGSPEERA